MLYGNSGPIRYAMVGCKKPPKVWIKLNVDGSVRREDPKERGGGLIRTEEGEWILGFM